MKTNPAKKFSARALSLLLTVVMVVSVVGPAFASLARISSNYQGFVLFSLTEQTYEYGWNRYIPSSTISNAAKYIYPRNRSVSYNGGKAYVGSSLYIKPGSYSLNLTEAGVLSYGSGYDTTVSSGSNYTYSALSGSPRVTKQTARGDYGTSWTYISLSNLKLGDVIRVNAYQGSHLLKVGDPSVRIYKGSKDITGAWIDSHVGEEFDLDATGFLDVNSAASGTIRYSSGDKNKVTIDSNGHVRVLQEGSATITATWTSSNGYFTASASTRIDIEDLSKKVVGISVKDYRTTYFVAEKFDNTGTIVATMADGSTKEFPLSSASSITGFNSGTAGQKTLTVTYDGCKTTFDVMVAYQPASISVDVQDPGGYSQKKTGLIVLGGNADHVTFPDGSVVKADTAKSYTFTENGKYTFTVTGMDGGTDSCTVDISTIDKEAPSLEVVYKDGTLTIVTQDDFSGVHTIEYVDEVFEEPNTGKWVSSSKTITDALDGVSPGKYRVVVTDHAGNSRSADIVVGGESAEPVEFSIYVPSSIQVTVNKDGSATTNPEKPKIYNGVKTLPICVTDIRVHANGEWSLVDYGTEFTDSDKDRKVIALSINGSPVSTDGSVEVDRDAWMIPADGVKELNLTFKVPQQTQAQTLDNVLKIDFQSDWYDASLVPGERYAVTLQPVEHATIKGTATMLYTDEYGRVPVLPRVITDEGHEFVRWEDGQGNTVVTGQVIDKDITIHPILESFYTVTLKSVAHASIKGTATVLYTGRDRKIPVLPSVTADAGYEFVGWADEQNQTIVTGQMIDKDIAIHPVLKSLLVATNISRSRMDGVFGSNGSKITKLTTAKGNPANGVDISVNQDRSVLATLNTATKTGTIYLNSSYLSGSLYVDGKGLFEGYETLISADLSGFDTSEVTNMCRMFFYCSNLEELDVSSFKTSNVTNMSHMFNNCVDLSALDLSGFDTSKVTKMNGMFCYCTRVKNLDLSSFDTSKVTDMSSMFQNVNYMENLDLSSFNTGNVTNMYRMFRCYASGSKSSLNLSSFDTRKVSNMRDMFYGCGSTYITYGNFRVPSGCNTVGMYGYDTNSYSLCSANKAPGYTG